MSSPEYDVVIIGSGISSLTCAILLSRMGKKVCVLEKHYLPGGYMHTFKRFNHTFETGAHYVGAMDRGQPFHTILNYLGVYDDHIFCPLDTDGFDQFQFDNFSYQFSVGYQSNVQRLGSEFPHERGAIKRFFQLIKNAASYFPSYSFNENINRDTLLRYLELPLKDVVESLTANPRLQSIFYSYCALHGVKPHEVSFGLHAVVMDSLIQSAHGFKQGGGYLARKFVEVFESHGGVLKLKAEVQKVHVTNNQVDSVELKDGQKITGKLFIAGIHPRILFQQLIGHEKLRPAFNSRVNKLKETPSFFGLYLMGEEKFEGIDCNKNYYLFQGEGPEIFYQYDKASTQFPGGLFICSSQRGHGALELGHPLTVFTFGDYNWFKKYEDTHFGDRPDEYRELKHSISQNIIDFIDSRISGFKSNIFKVESSSPLSNIHFNGSYQGSAYGIYHDIGATGARSLGPRTHFKNLLLTGQNTLFPGLLGASISGLRTCGQVVGLPDILNDLSDLQMSCA